MNDVLLLGGNADVRMLTKSDRQANTKSTGASKYGNQAGGAADRAQAHPRSFHARWRIRLVPRSVPRLRCHRTMPLSLNPLIDFG